MKLMIAGVSALFLSGSAMAASQIGNDTHPFAAASPAYYAHVSVPPMSNPNLARVMGREGLEMALAMNGPAGSMDPNEWTGMGGPEEPVQTVWPACSPGPGDDRCIQLYERGVRASYAAWTDRQSETGMGGPEEGDDLAAKDSSLGRMITDTPHPGAPGKENMAMTHPDATMSAVTAEEMQDNSAWAQHGGMNDYTGVGGPIEDEPRLYPPCRSRSDDRCQQGR